MTSLKTKPIKVLLSLILTLLLASPAHSWWFLKSKSRTSEYTKTLHPIVLMPGLAGFDNIANLIIYWPDVVHQVERSGGKAYIVNTNIFGSTAQRGDTVIRQLEELQATYGYQRFNLIGHSQGGLDARYIAGVKPELVASVTTLGSPNASINHTQLSVLLDNKALIKLGSLLGEVMASLSNNNNAIDLDGALFSVSDKGMRVFNELFPWGLPDTFCGEGKMLEWIDGYPVYYYSWMGNRIATNPLDPGDIISIVGTHTLPKPNDGLVNVCSSHLGKVIRDNYKLNHLDYANLLFGLSNWWETRPEILIRAHANRLKNAGL